eukprot:770872-Rhodomonas_salina.1
MITLVRKLGGAVSRLAWILGVCKALILLQLDEEGIGAETGRMAGWSGTGKALVGLSFEGIGDEGAGRQAGLLVGCKRPACLGCIGHGKGADGTGRLAGWLGELKALAHLGLSKNKCSGVEKAG